MNPLDELERLLNEHKIASTRQEDSLLVAAQAPEGFAVLVEKRGPEWVLSLEECSIAITEELEVVNCTLFVLSDMSRLAVLNDGVRDVRWILQYKHAGDWHDWVSKRRISFRFWQKSTTRFLQNGVSGILPELGNWSDNGDQAPCS